MQNLKWSESEKKNARSVFDAALEAELADTMRSFKAKAAAITTPDDLWALLVKFERKRLEINEQFDYRYSQLIIVFGRLLRDGRVFHEQLRGLSEEKVSLIERIAYL